MDHALSQIIKIAIESMPDAPASEVANAILNSYRGMLYVWLANKIVAYKKAQAR